MAQSLRIEYEGAFYHITARGNERKPIFFTIADYKKFKQYLKEAKQKYRYILHGYVLMRNHYHLLMETPQANLRKIMHYINSSYTTYINIRRKSNGHLFQGRYKSIVIDKDNYLVSVHKVDILTPSPTPPLEGGAILLPSPLRGEGKGEGVLQFINRLYLLELSRYIHLNPVRAGIVEKPEDYEQSSYRAHITKAEGDISNQGLILSMISKDKGEARKKYKVFVENAIGKELKNPLKEAYGGIILGGVQFIKETLKKVERGKLRDEEIANRRKIKAVMMQDILKAAKDYYGISEDIEISKDTGERRKVLIYMIKKHTGATNREIGEHFGRLSYSAVAKINDRFKRRLKEDKGLRREVEKLEKSV